MQAAVDVSSGVCAVVESGVCKAVGVSVGRDRLIFVGGRVEVAKRGGVGEAGCCEILIQEARLKAERSVNIQIFFIQGFHIEIIKKLFLTHHEGTLRS